MELPPLALDRAGEHPLPVQLADALRAATAAGTLRPGDRLPSTRALAGTLGVSRTVTAAAYDQLLAEGWVGARCGAGTFTEAVPPVADGSKVALLQSAGVDLSARSPCVEALDSAAWRRAWRAAATTEAVQRLVVKGLLTRDTDPADRRRAVIARVPAWGRRSTDSTSRCARASSRSCAATRSRSWT